MKKALMQAEWFIDWFDSPYYHILYKYRDDTEAKEFIDCLLRMLQPKTGARILDLACGRGRYSRHIARKGYEVVGLDLSPQSIAYARQHEQDNLSFYTHDMRLPFRINYFDYTFSFFTSFGYFEEEQEDLRMLKSVAAGLRPGGFFVLDFFNARYVTSRLQGKEAKEVEGIVFHIHKYQDGLFVRKNIEFEAQGRLCRYEEKVRLFTLPELEGLFHAADLRILRTFGDYQLGPYREAESPRLILLAQYAP
jgi:SAM-dependent methyltransferase